MDIYCPTCAEPWDNDCIHDEVDARRDAGDTEATYQTVMREFQRKGCKALATAYGLGAEDCQAAQDDSSYLRAALAGAAYDLLGDDMDGAAAELSDYFALHNL